MLAVDVAMFPIIMFDDDDDDDNVDGYNITTQRC